MKLFYAPRKISFTFHFWHVFYPLWCETCRTVIQQLQSWMKEYENLTGQNILWLLLHIFRGSWPPIPHDLRPWTKQHFVDIIALEGFLGAKMTFWGHSKSSLPTQIDRVSMILYINAHSNYGPVLYRFQNIARHCPITAMFSYPISISGPVQRRFLKSK